MYYCLVLFEPSFEFKRWEGAAYFILKCCVYCEIPSNTCALGNHPITHTVGKSLITSEPGRLCTRGRTEVDLEERGS